MPLDRLARLKASQSLYQRTQVPPHTPRGSQDGTSQDLRTFGLRIQIVLVESLAIPREVNCVFNQESKEQLDEKLGVFLKEGFHFDRDIDVSPHVLFLKGEGSVDKPVYDAAERIVQQITYVKGTLLSQSFMERVFNVVLPPGIIRVGERDQMWMAVPILSFFSKLSVNEYDQNVMRFRRTFSVSLILCNTDGSGISVDEVDADKILSLEAETEGPLASYLRLAHPYYRDYPGRSVNSLFRTTVQSAIYSISGTKKAGTSLYDSRRGPKTPREDALDECLAKSGEATVTGVVAHGDLPRPPGMKFPWSKWISNGEDPIFQETLFQIFRAEFGEGNTTWDNVKLRELCINDKYNLGIFGIELLLPGRPLILSLGSSQVCTFETFSDTTLGWIHIFTQFLASLSEMTKSYLRDVESRGSLSNALDISKQLVRDFEEIYDADIKSLVFRDEYENARRIAHLDDDYNYMKEGIQTLQNQASTEESSRLSHRIHNLTWFIVIFTIISAWAAFLASLSANSMSAGIPGDSNLTYGQIRDILGQWLWVLATLVLVLYAWVTLRHAAFRGLRFVGMRGRSTWYRGTSYFSHHALRIARVKETVGEGYGSSKELVNVALGRLLSVISPRLAAGRYYEAAHRPFSKNDFRRAISYNSKAIELKSDYYNAYFNRALSEAILGRNDQAKQDITVVMKAQPDKADAPYVMGVIAEYEDDLKKAAEYYKKSIDLDPKFEPASRRLERVEGMLLSKKD